jgi:UDP-glucose 4-epimerase
MHKIGNLIPNFLLKTRNNESTPIMPIYGDGLQTRDFIYIDDIVNAITKSILKDDIGYEVFQLANSKEYTINEVFNIMNDVSKEIFGKTVYPIFKEERKGEVRRNYAIIDKAKEVLG